MGSSRNQDDEDTRLVKKPVIKLAYIAGPYRAKTREGVQRNVESALQVARLVAAKGYYPVVPHACTQMFDWDYPQLQNDDFWLEATLQLMRKCDLIVLCSGWSASFGTKAEVAEAERLGMRVVLSVDCLDAVSA